MQVEIPAIAGVSHFGMTASCPVVSASHPHRKVLGETIRRCRKKAGLTQEQLGELAELNPKYVGEVERAEKTISVDKLVRIAAALKVRTRDLVRGI